MTNDLDLTLLNRFLNTTKDRKNNAKHTKIKIAFQNVYYDIPLELHT